MAAKKRQKSVAPARTYEIPQMTAEEILASANMALGAPSTSTAATGVVPAAPVAPITSPEVAAAYTALGQAPSREALTGVTPAQPAVQEPAAPTQEPVSQPDMQPVNLPTNVPPVAQPPTTTEPTTPGATRPSGGMTYDNLVEFLNEYGLGGGEIPRLLRAAIEDDPTQFSGPFAQQAVFRTVRNTTEYKERFKGLKMRQDAGLPPISEAQYIAIENDYRQVLRSNGMPRGFYDSEADFAKFIGGDIRADELNTRIQAGYRAVTEAEPGTKDELMRLYGIDEPKLAAFFLDPTRAQTQIVKAAEAARRATAAREQGFQIQAGTAEELVTRGVSQREASQGFQSIAEQRGLFEAQMAGETAITQEEQIAGTFGTSAAAAQRIATRRRRRQAEFEAGGGFAAGQRGIAGLGTANQ